jgi:hypothetical protein
LQNKKAANPLFERSAAILEKQATGIDACFQLSLFLGQKRVF